MNKQKQPLRTFNLSLAVAGLITAGTAWGADPPQNVPASKVDDAALAAAGEASADWLTHGLNPYEDRYSRLDQINQGNIKQLGLAWATKIGLTQGIEATPIVADGIMYFTGMWSIVYAVDCRDGSILWAWDPGVDRAVNGGKPCCGVVNRGVALYKGRIYVGVIDGRLVSLDARTGKPVWEVVTVDLNPLSRTARAASVTVVDNVVRAVPVLIEEIGKAKKKSTRSFSQRNKVCPWR